MSEHSVSQYRKELLYRKASGKKVLNDYLGKIASLFPTEDRPEIVPLEETDVALNRFKEASGRLHRETARISAGELHAELSAMRRHQGDVYVLIDEDWKHCGMLLTRSMEGLNVSVQFGKKILNDLIFISADMSAATSFDFFEVAGNYLIDMQRWRAK